MDKPLSPLLVTARGGWTLHYGRYTSAGGSNYGPGTLSHYGDTWQSHLEEMADGCVGVNSKTVAENEIVTYALAGPIVDVDLEPGLVRGWTSLWVWQPNAQVGNRDARFGNAGSLDYVAVDVYVEIAERFGAEIFDARVRACAEVLA